MDAFRPSRFTSGQEPWFRIGTLDFGSAGAVSLAGLIGMVLASLPTLGSSLTTSVAFVSDSVLNGEIWRMLTWWFPNDPSIWTVISIVLIFMFGAQLEGALGREGMAKYLIAHVIGISVLALAIALVFSQQFAFAGVSFISSALFYSYIAYLPQARFFFGIPGWVLGAVFFFLEFLQLLSISDSGSLALLVLRLVFTLLMAKAFGLAESLEWIPDLRPGGNRTGGLATAAGTVRAPKAPKARGGRKSKSKADLSVVPDEQRFEDLGIDDILDQINAFGMDSLSSDQKKILKQYSKGKKKND